MTLSDGREKHKRATFDERRNTKTPTKPPISKSFNAIANGNEESKCRVLPTHTDRIESFFFALFLFVMYLRRLSMRKQEFINI